MSQDSSVSRTPRFDLGNSLNFQHAPAAQRIFCGSDSLASLGRELDRLGCSRAVIISGASLARDEGTTARLRDALGSKLAGWIPGTVEHSPVPAVLEVSRELERLQADAVIAVGGGSPIVTARAASIMLAEGSDAHRLCSQQDAGGKWISPRLVHPKLPQLVVPTTPTTACVKAGSAVLDPVSGRRLALFDPKTRAHAVFIDPQLVNAVPASLVLSASMNTLAMAIEGLESPQANPFSDALLMQSVRLLSDHLVAAINDDAHGRCELVVAAALCGQGTDFGGAGLASVLGHAIGHRHGVANGVVNAIVLPHTMQFNARATERGAPKIGMALGAASQPRPNIKDAINRLQTLLGTLPVPTRLRDVGIAQSELGQIAEDAMGDWFLQRNPRPVASSAEVLSLLQSAW
ncbi:iron-containing alcohol dehydrogenase family protein [Ottowia thiooxydans]|uniref:iron-containing alcohol dehydrogenase family protein n=1 Tax=Ottowia thiooxydans TaxID=219182 RepID=UPI000426CAFF|nr:iron-containing alcohol dehydrogenase family protein [Ottowia thiooxydans]